jgi:hypothetical protein
MLGVSWLRCALSALRRTPLGMAGVANRVPRQAGSCQTE